MMLRRITCLAPLALLLGPLGLAPVCWGQEQGVGRALGAVTKIDAAQRQITLQTTAGDIAVSVDAKAKVLRVAPGATNLSSAAAIELNDIKVGDRLRARGRMGEDQKSLAALEIVVISQSDIASKQAADRTDWDRRGATGIVADVQGDSVTINLRTLEGLKPLVIAPAPNAVIRRYAPDSVKFSDAQPSKISEIRKGDQVRARGNRTPDGTQMTAEEIVSGQFKIIAGLVLSVDPQANAIRINNIETKKPMTVKISADSSVKKLQPMLAGVIANILHGGQAPAFPGARRADMQSVIDRTPVIKISDLMAGDAIIVSSTAGATADQVTAITLLAGVEPILTKPGTREMSLGDWNLGGGGDLGGIGQ